MSAIPAFRKQTYIDRRNELCRSVGSGKILLIGNGHSPINFKDNYSAFRQDSTFLYYIGINLPKVYAIIDIDSNNATLYGDELTMDDIIWMGNQEPLSAIAEKVGVTQLRPLSQPPTQMKGVHYLPPYRSEHVLFLREKMGSTQLKPSTLLIKSIVNQRNVKSKAEIQHLDNAVNISNLVQSTVIKNTKPGIHEYELVGLATKVVKEQNTNWAYSPILTTQGQILHNHDHSRKLAEGGLVLFDGGVELASAYCGDLTRTFPVGKKFTSLQKDIYQIVLNAYHLAVALSRPGVKFKDIHLKASQKLVEGLIAIGWMTGDPAEAVASGAHTLFFQCGLGHMIGMDVHDMENLGEEYVGYDNEAKSTEFGLKSLRLGREMKKDFCFTIEPGIYIIPQLIDKFISENKYSDYVDYEELNKHRDFGGIRIEDDFVITADGTRKLGGPLALEVSAIEEMSC